ncbi:hypothetical protein [Inediibacterium massiliense]|uniref:hypothetical protein n=1 Tax=Inediibacterium massiliense TaxID=1658111 RepID=UPI0006B6709B|nr:hypothetical protein [Inediibacterium massiliense]
MSFFNLPPDTFSILATLLGLGIANGLDLNQQNSLGNFIEQLGQTILTVSAQAQSQQSQQEQQQQNEQIQLQIEYLKKQIEYLEKQVKK